MDKNQELKNRFYKNQLHSFDDREILEFLLSLKSVGYHRKLANRMINSYSSLNNILDETDDRLLKIPGLQLEQLVGLKLPNAVANRYLKEQVMQAPIFECPSAVYDYLQHTLRGKKREHFDVLYLNGRNRLIKSETISVGGLNSAPVYPREVFKQALLYDAAGLIVAHNHPSGDTTPSQEDRLLTRQLYDCSKNLGISFLDHIIIGGSDYFSFANSGLLGE